MLVIACLKWALVGPAGFEPTTFPRNSALAPFLRVSLTAPEPLHPLMRSVNPFATFWSPSSYLPRLRPHFLPENVMGDFEYMRYSFDPKKQVVAELAEQSDKFMNANQACSLGLAGHRAWVPPDPIPNSEVKPRSVSGCSVVFGYANPGKLASPLKINL